MSEFDRRHVLSAGQRRFVVAAWITYAAFYLGRVNLAPAIAALQADLGWTKTEIGWLGTLFFWTYGVGQLVNGPLGERLSAVRMVTIGLAASALVNLLFGFSSAFPIMLLAWSINGYLQAMGWGPILHLLAQRLNHEQRTRVSAVFGSSFVAGNALTWLLAGIAVSALGWRAAFLGATPLMVIFAALWLWLARGAEIPAGPPASPKIAAAATTGFFRQPGLWIAGGIATLAGVVQGGFFLWTPTLLHEVQNIPLDTATYSAVLLPIAGIAGIVGFGRLISGVFTGTRALGGLAALLICEGVLIVLYRQFATQMPFWAGLSLFALIGAVAYAATSLILTLLPMRIGGRARSSTAAGAMDFSFNLGASISSFITGLLLDRFSWDAVFLFWACAALAAAVLLATQYRRLPTMSD